MAIDVLFFFPASSNAKNICFRRFTEFFTKINVFCGFGLSTQQNFFFLLNFGSFNLKCFFNFLDVSVSSKPLLGDTGQNMASSEKLDISLLLHLIYK